MFRNPDVDAYLNGLEPQQRRELASLRAVIFETLPDADEQIRYGRPFYDGDGAVCAFAGHKRTCCVYIMDAEVLEKHRGRLDTLHSGKHHIRFREIGQLPMNVIKAMLLEVREKNRAAGQDLTTQTKTAKRKTPERLVERD